MIDQLHAQSHCSCNIRASVSTYECKHAKMPYRCRTAASIFLSKPGQSWLAPLIPLLKWLYAIYLDTTSLKGVSSMKLHRDLSVTQKTAWFMQQRIREAFAALGPNVRFGGPVEVDESYIGGRESNKHESKKRRTGRGTAGKTAVAGLRDRPTWPNQSGSRARCARYNSTRFRGRAY